jgi:hypothetical protein
MTYFAKLCAWFALCIFSCLGCNGGQQVIEGRTIVSGKVTLNGQPLRGGSVTFISKENDILSKTVSINSDGTYRTDRAATGKSSVTVDTESLKFGNMAAYVPIPAKYTSAATSGLEVDLKPGTNENVDFALEGQAK